MAKLNIFADGTWLLYQCGAGQSLANATDHPAERFELDFSKLVHALLKHAQIHGGHCDSFGDAFVATSIFSLPDDFDDWPNRFDAVTTEHVEKTRRAVLARNRFVEAAVAGGFKMDAVFRPQIKDHIMTRLAEKRYQEKQVDTSVVALLVKYAIMQPRDYHAVITGDSDILPAIHVAYPEFTKNVFLVSTHPDELNAAHRQTAFSYLDFPFSIPPFFLQMKENVERILAGEHVHRCEECGRVFRLLKSMPAKSRPRCRLHRAASA